MGMMSFCWISSRPIPPGLDLGRRGWHGVVAPEPEEVAQLGGNSLPSDCAILADGAFLAGFQQRALSAASAPTRARVLLTGIERSTERTGLLAAGFGDACNGSAGLDEIEQRALRLLRLRKEAVLCRRAGPVLLDLSAREAWLAGRRIALHPREFGLLWKLAEEPGLPCDRILLLREVFLIAHDPGTNRVAVHISRLRAKLAAAGVRDLIETTATGEYRLAGPSRAAPVQASFPFGWPPSGLVVHCTGPLGRVRAPQTAFADQAPAGRREPHCVATEEAPHLPEIATAKG